MPPRKFAVLAEHRLREAREQVREPVPEKPQMLTVHCAICRNWSFDGEAAEARAQFTEHRLREHTGDGKLTGKAMV